jgi:hypothetical protein
MLIKTDSDGNEQWSNDLGGIITITSVVQAEDESYAVGGIGAGDAPNSFALVKTDLSGSIIWSKTYPSVYTNVGEDSRLSNLFSTSDGGYILAGTMNAYTGAHKPSYPWLLKVDTNGTVAWSQTYGGGDMIASSQTSDGGCAFISSSAGGGGTLLLVKVDVSGEMEWSQIYPGVSYGRSLVQGSDGGYAIAYGDGNGLDGFSLAKTDWLGNMQWNRKYDAPGNDTISWSLTRTNDNGYALLGYTNVDSSLPNASGLRIWVLKTDKDGNPQWNQTYGGPDATEGRSIIQTSEGNLVIAGQVENYKEVNTNHPPFVCLLKLSNSSRSSTSPILIAAIAISLVLIVAFAAAVIISRKRRGKL